MKTITKSKIQCKICFDPWDQVYSEIHLRVKHKMRDLLTHKVDRFVGNLGHHPDPDEFA